MSRGGRVAFHAADAAVQRSQVAAQAAKSYEQPLDVREGSAGNGLFARLGVGGLGDLLGVLLEVLPLPEDQLEDRSGPGIVDVSM